MQTHTDLHEAWSEALGRGDVETMLGLYHPHAVIETPLGRWHGTGEIHDALDAGLLRKWRHHQVVAARRDADRVAFTTVHGDWVIEHVMQFVGRAIRAHRLVLRGTS